MMCLLSWKRAKESHATTNSSLSHRPTSPPMRKTHYGRTGPGAMLHTRCESTSNPHHNMHSRGIPKRLLVIPDHSPERKGGGTHAGIHPGGVAVSDKLAEMNKRIKELEEEKAALESSKRITADKQVAAERLGSKDWPGTCLHELATLQAARRIHLQRPRRSTNSGGDSLSPRGSPTPSPRGDFQEDYLHIRATRNGPDLDTPQQTGTVSMSGCMLMWNE